MMGCKTGLVTRLQECYPEVEEIESDREAEIESEREIHSNKEGERDSEENRDESDVDSDAFSFSFTKTNISSELVDWGSPIHTNLVIIFL
jgi:hypothetical protein